ncbi:MAG: hypothetical protein U9N86_07490, partial [Bacteroidota bacterium]|nr:hypothetical protein [Bacteroidota bacterium]
STFNVLNEFGKALMHPMATANTIGEVVLGGVEKLIPGEQQAEQTFDMLIEGFKDKYGSLEQLNHTIANDPASVLLDISALMTSGGTLLTKVPQTAAYGDAMLQAGKTIDPILATAKASGKMVKGGKDIVQSTLGTLTGEGTQAMKIASKGEGITTESSPYLQGLRKEIPVEKVVGTMVEGLRKIKDTRSKTYRVELSKIKQNKASIDTTPIKEHLDDLMSENNYNISITDKGKLDFSRSSIQRSERTKIQEIFNDVKSWGSKQGDNTVIGLDTLKKKLDNFYSENANTRAFVTSMRNKVKDTIAEKVPEYAKMTENYKKTTDLINELEKSLSLGGKTSMTTTLKKIISVGRDDFDFRKNLVKELENITGESIMDQITGISMQDVIPERLFGRIAAGGTLGVVTTGANPWILTVAAATSPKVMGEFLNFMGFSKNQVNKAVNNLKKMGIFNQQTEKAIALSGRTDDEGVQP